MFKTKVKIKYPSPVVDENGNVVVVPIDQFPSQDFARNAAGWPSNDISLIARAQTEQEYQMIAQRLQELKFNNPDNSKMSDRDILKQIWYRGNQTPSEIDNYLQYYFENVSTTISQQPVVKIEDVHEPPVEPQPEA